MALIDFSPPAPKSGLIGHRGIAALAPENTLASFSLAAELGIEWVEFDVRLTKDNELIIFHDDTLERTTNGQGLVYEHTLAELAVLDAGSWFHPRFTAEPIPVFAEMIAKLNQLNLFLNIELKVPENASGQHCDVLAARFIDIMLALWPIERAWPLVSSFDWRLLKTVREALPQVPIGFLQSTCSVAMIEMVANTNNSALHCNYESLNEALLAKCLSLAIPVLAYTVNQPDIAKYLLNAGLYGVFSDNPQTLLS